MYQKDIKTQSIYRKSIYISIRNNVTKGIIIVNKIDDVRNNIKATWKIINELLSSVRENVQFDYIENMKLVSMRL